MKIFDNHVHLRRDTVDFFLQRFLKKGGNGINLINLTEGCLNLEQFKTKYDETILLSQKLRKEGLTVVTTIGPYPVNYIGLRETLGKEKSMNLYFKAIDSAIRLIEDGNANAIGEVGRPHFDTPKEIISESNEIISYIFASTKDKDIPIILHTESLDSKGMCELMELAKKNGKKDRIVKHFSQPVFVENCGMIPSVPASRKNARLAPWGKQGFFLETDFAGDESDPDFVLPADSVPSRVAMLLQEGVEEDKIEYSMSFFERFYNLI